MLKERRERKTPKTKGIRVTTKAVLDKDIIKKEIPLEDKPANILMGKLIEQGVAKFLYYSNDCRYFQIKKLI
jgi:hypothetical protein